MQKSRLFRFLLFMLAMVMAFSMNACSSFQNDDEDEDDDPKKSSDEDGTNKALNLFKNGKKDSKDSYKNLVINDVAIKEEDFFNKTAGGSSYLLLNSEVFKYAFKMPYSSSIYPDISTSNGQISISWTDGDNLILKVDMVEGSREAYINTSDEPVDIGEAPVTYDEKLFIPINLFTEIFKMKETYDRTLKMTFLHGEEAFPKELLLGKWSDTDTDLFTAFQDVVTGAMSLSSFAQGYQFNKDGTYSVLVISVGGFEDGLVQCHGKYKVLGNTLIYYDVYETLYEGTPFKLVHKNKKLENPSFEFIEDYNPDGPKIEIGGFWHYKLQK